MFEIAGGIIIAVVALYLLPLVILALPWIILGGIGLLLLVLGIQLLASLSAEELGALFGALFGLLGLGAIPLVWWLIERAAGNARRAKSALDEDGEVLVIRTRAAYRRDAGDGDTHH